MKAFKFPVKLKRLQKIKNKAVTGLKKPTLKQDFQLSWKQANLFVQGYVKGESLCSLMVIWSRTFPIPNGVTGKGGATNNSTERHKPNR